MTNQKELFNKNIESVSIIDSIYQYMESQVTAFDLTELLRAEFVLIVSALDFYVHGIVREGLMKQFAGTDISNKNTVSIPLSTVKVLLHINSEEEQKKILDEQIKEITSKHSYQAPRAIEKALGMININKIWSRISNILSISADDTQRTLALIINRRNKIAHEADINFITGEKTEITQTAINDCLEFTTLLVEAIDQIIEFH